MRIFLQKLLTARKTLFYGAILAMSLITPTAFIFAKGVKASASGPGILADTMTFLMWPFHILMTASGSLMGVTMYYTVVRMGYYVHQLSAIQTAWELFRDLGNIFIVFGFIAIGIATILDNATYGAKKALPKLLIVAILLNFSLFFAEFIVDAGNVFATQFYSSISGGHLPSSASTFSVSKEPISGSVMTVLKTTGLYNKKVPSLQTGQTIELGVLSIIMFIIMAFTFFAIAIMLISRFVILLFLFIVSPIGFIGLAGIPLISDYGKKWWKALTDQTLLAPILFLFLLVVTKMIQSNFMQKLTGSGTLASAVSSTNVTPVANMLMAFAVVVGLLFVSLITAKSLSGKAANFAINRSRGLMARSFSLPIGGAARLLRGAARISGDNKFSRGVGHFTRPLERANFDMVGALGGKQALGMSKLKDASFRHTVTHLPLVGEDGVIKRIREKNLAEMDIDEKKNQKKEAEKDTRRASEEKESAQKYKSDAVKEMRDLEEKQASNPEPKEKYTERKGAIQARIDSADKKIENSDKTISDSLSKLSIAEVAKLDEIKKGVGTLAQSLSPERFSMLMKSDSLTDAQKSKLRDQRYEPIAQAVASGDAGIIKNQSPKDLEQYAEHNPSGFKTMGAMFSDSQIKKLQESGHLTATQKKELKVSYGARFSNDGDLSGSETKALEDRIEALGKEVKKMSIKDIAKLPTDALSNPKIIRNISSHKIIEMLDKDILSSDNEHRAVVKHVQREMTADTEDGKRFINALISDPTAGGRWGI